MRVLHVYRTYFPDSTGGLPEAIRQICLTTKKFGCSSTIFTLSPDPNPVEIDLPEGHVFRGRSWAALASCDLGGIASFRQFAELARLADVINYHFPWPFADLLHLAVLPTAPAVMTYHSDVVRQKWLGRLYAPVMHRMLGSMAAVVATSHAYVRTSSVLTNYPRRENVRVIPLGLEEESYPAAADYSILRRLGLDTGEPFFLFIGVLRYYKGLHALVEAAASVRARVVIAGSGPEGDALKMQADRIGATNVIFAGQITDAEKVALLQCCRALTLPSHLRSEAYGMVLVEAAMYGRPMISCEIGTGTSFVNVDGKTGIVVSPEKPSEQARAMNYLLENEAVVQRYGRAARKRYEKMFSSDAFGCAYYSLYREVTARGTV